MANLSSLNKWIISNQNRLELDVTKITWTKEWLPKYFDYKIQIKINEINYVGRGLDKDESIAFDKAAAESLERAAVDIANLDSAVGFAAHPDLKMAKYRAYFELLGFDRVFCHHHSRCQFDYLPLEITERQLPIKSLKKQLLQHDLILSLYEMQPTSDAKSATAFIWCCNNDNISKPGFVSGFGCDFSIESAAIHAVLECLREGIAVFIEKQQCSPELLSKLEMANDPQWHFWINQNNKRKEELFENIVPSTSCKKILNMENIAFETIKFKEIESLSSIFQDLPIKIVQAQSDHLAHPQFGNIELSEHNKKRLAIFYPSLINPVRIPHFYG